MISNNIIFDRILINPIKSHWLAHTPYFWFQSFFKFPFFLIPLPSIFVYIKAHRFRGVWHCILRGPMLFTGGADGSIKAWNLWDILEKDDVIKVISTFKKSTTTTQSLTKDLLEQNSNTRIGITNGIGQEEDSMVEVQLPWKLTALCGSLPDPETAYVGAVALPSRTLQPSHQAIPAPSSESESSSEQTTKRASLKFDSTTEWIRCLALSKDHSTLFIATNRGLLHQVELPVASSSKTAEARLFREASGDPEGVAGGVTVGGKKEILEVEERWTTLFKSDRKRPFATLNVTEDEETIRIGVCDIFGYAVTLLRRKQQHPSGEFSSLPTQQGEDGQQARADVIFGSNSPKVAEGWECHEWKPYEKKAALAAHFIKGMPENYVFTTGPGGQLTLWSLPNAILSSYDDIDMRNDETIKSSSSSTTTTPGSGEKNIIDLNIIDSFGEGFLPLIVADGACGFNRATLLVAIDGIPVSITNQSNFGFTNSSNGEKPKVIGNGDASARSESANFAPWKAPGFSSSSEGGNGEIIVSNSDLNWLVATGTSWGGIVLWRLNLHFEATAPDGGNRAVLPKGTLTLLSTVKDVHIGTPVRGISLRAIESAARTAGSGRIEVESQGSNGTVVRFDVGQGGQLAILGEDRYDSILVIAGKTENPAISSNETTFGDAAVSAGHPLGGVSNYKFKSSTRSGLVYGFQTTNFILWDEGVEAQVCSVFCSSWRRPWAVQVTAVDKVTFCWNSSTNNEIMIYTRRPYINNSSSVAKFDIPSVSRALPLAFLPPGHGREINALALIPNNLHRSRSLPRNLLGSIVNGAREIDNSDHDSNGNTNHNKKSTSTTTNDVSIDGFTLPITRESLFCLTGGEDASIRQAVIEVPSFGSNEGSTSDVGLMQNVGLVSDHVGGNSVKAIAHALIPLDSSTTISSTNNSTADIGRKSLVVVGGSRQAMMAWVVTHQEKIGRKEEDTNRIFGCESGEMETPWECELLSTHASPAVFSVKNLPEVRELALVFYPLF